MSDTFSVQVSGTESLGFDFSVRVQDTHAPELPVHTETAEYFTGAPCPLMPALILHGALQDELPGDVCVCVCAPVPAHTCVCVGCVLMSCGFFLWKLQLGHVWCWVFLFFFTSPENPQPVFCESKMRACFLTQLPP